MKHRFLSRMVWFSVLVISLLAFSSASADEKPVEHPQQPGTTLKGAETPPADSGQVTNESEFSDEDETDDAFDMMDDNMTGEFKSVSISDPLEPINRGIFIFNDKLYFWVLKPVCLGYNKIVMQPIRTAVRNFFDNLAAPVRMVNCFLQGKGERLGKEIARFMVNTTIGLGGILNPAQDDPRLNNDSEDFGQTLGVYGFGAGCYLVLPMLGPSTLRDSVGLTVDGYFLDPIAYVKPWEASSGISGYKTLNETSFKIGDYEALKAASIEPYNAIRDGYVQYRKKKIGD